MALAKEAAHYKNNLVDDMQAIQRKHGVSLVKQLSDFMALRQAGTGMSFEEYIRYGLFKAPREAFNAYMGENRMRAVFLLANKLTSWDAAEDKLYYAQLVEGAGLPTPKVIALAHETRRFAGAENLRNEAEIAAFLRAAPLPLFGKPVIAAHGNKTIKLVGREGDELIAGDGERNRISELAKDIFETSKDAGYLFQEVLTPHADVASLTGGRLGTARFMTFTTDAGPELKYCVLRLPAGEHYVDSYQRPGNLIAPIDIETGVLKSARRGAGVSTEEVDIHPDTNRQISGTRISDFQKAKAIVLEATRIYPALRLQSWDVAFTDRGPVLVEVNPGGNFMILQMANGRGVFDADFRKFLEECLKANPSARANQKAFKEAKKLLQL
ncbi:MAG: sugar-transfer associated ATP-grasp domain-containing protein [Parvularculaceae bacterium]